MPRPRCPFPHAEERRLFYVALTRARRKVTLITWPDRMSPFVVELLECPYVTITGDPDAHVEICPMCAQGTMVQRQGKFGVFLGRGALDVPSPAALLVGVFSCRAGRAQRSEECPSHASPVAVMTTRRLGPKSIPSFGNHQMRCSPRLRRDRCPANQSVSTRVKRLARSDAYSPSLA